MSNGGGNLLHGRASKYARAFGEKYVEAYTDPKILECSAEIALFDTFLAERAELMEDGFSEEWLSNVSEAMADLKPHLRLLLGPNARLAWKRLQELVAEGGKRIEAWNELLAAAKQRSDLATKVIAATGGDKVTEARMLILFNRFLDVVENVVDRNTAANIARRLDRELFPNVQESPGLQIRPGTLPS